MTHTPHPAPVADADGREHRRLAQVYRNVWVILMETADDLRLDREAALNLTTAVIELTRLGYVLTADETDWQPPTPASEEA